MLENELVALVQEIKDSVKGKISTAESCTGGLLGAYLTSLSGSSAYFTGGIISYSNEAKIKLLNVNKETLNMYGAVSEQVAIEMARGARDIINSDIAVSITGIAGPNGGSKRKPVGTVCFGIANERCVKAYTHHFAGSREQVRMQSCKMALELILKLEAM